MEQGDILTRRDYPLLLVFLGLLTSLVANATVTGGYLVKGDFSLLPVNMGISLLGILLLYGIAVYNHLAYVMTIMLSESAVLYDSITAAFYGLSNVPGENSFSLFANLIIIPLVVLLLFLQWKKFAVVPVKG